MNRPVTKTGNSCFRSALFITLCAAGLSLFTLRADAGNLKWSWKGARLVKKLFRDKKYDRVVRILRRRLRQAGDDLTARTLLGLAYFRDGDRLAATREWNLVMKEDPGNKRAARYLKAARKRAGAGKDDAEKMRRAVEKAFALPQYQLFHIMDKNRDDLISPFELAAVARKRYVQRVFFKYDRNSDGRLDKTEIHRLAFRTIKSEFQPIIAMDENKDGQLTLEEVENAVGDRKRAEEMMGNLNLMTRNLFIFLAADIDHNHVVSRDELIKITGEERADDILLWSDRDGDGGLTFDESEFLFEAPAREEASRHFREYDTNGDGFLDEDEIDKQLGPDEATKAILLFDRDGDRKISLREQLHTDQPFKAGAPIFGLDEDGDLELSCDELLPKLGKKATRLFINNLDRNNNKAVSFGEMMMDFSVPAGTMPKKSTGR